METIKVHNFDATYDLIECDESVAADLNDYFAFEVPNHKYMGRMKDPLTGKWVQTRRGWDGKIRLFKKQSHKLYVGLRMRLVEFCAERELKLLFPKEEDEPATFKENMVAAAQVVNNLNLPFTPYDFQLKALLTCIHNHRRIILSATGSGKSLMIYMLIRYFMSRISGKILLLVPTIHLVHQMVNDFKSYGFDADEDVHLIYGGEAKSAEQQIYISTWQSIYDLPREYFKEFDMIVCDEVHGATAKSIKHIMENSVNAKLRFGFTGTLEDLPVHRLQLEGLFGSIEQVAKTMELVEKKILSKPILKSFTMKYPKETCKAICGADYPTEVDFLCNHIQRNNFLKNLALRCKGNTLVLFRHIDHGKLLHFNIGYNTKRPMYLIYGKVPGEEREEIRQILTKENNAILVASYGTLSTGSNIPSLRHIIFASPYKSKTKVLQSIGRGTRLDEGKTEFTVWDIADDLSYGNWENHTLKHMVRRTEIYAEEGFDYQLINIQVDP